jgi:hypothetical protein
MDTNVQRIDPDRPAVRPTAPRARRRPGAFFEALEGDPDTRPGAEGEPAPTERDVAPPAADESGTRLDVVG